MTWLADVQKDRPDERKREKLLKDREKLEAEIAVMQMTPLRNATNSAKIGRQEDLMALAKKIKAIDRKLGRVEV